jgi:hypothetical protein
MEEENINSDKNETKESLRENEDVKSYSTQQRACSCFSVWRRNKEK